MNSSASSSLNPVAPKKITGLQGPWRRVLFVGLYELIAIVCASGLFMLIGQQPGESGAMAVAASVIAMSWNVTFNHWFERWERAKPSRAARSNAASPMRWGLRAGWGLF